VLAAELLPEFTAHAVAALAGLEGYDFTFRMLVKILGGWRLHIPRHRVGAFMRL
jgi:hypothetical protein